MVSMSGGSKTRMYTKSSSFSLYYYISDLEEMMLSESTGPVAITES